MVYRMERMTFLNPIVCARVATLRRGGQSALRSTRFAAAWSKRGTRGRWLLHALSMITLAVHLLIMPDPVVAQETGDGQPFAELTPASRQAVQLGLAYLAENQAEDGSFGGTRFPKHVGITGLACMAFMADGHMPGRGVYGTHVQRGLDFILNHSSESGLIAADTSHGPMYGHGYAALFLGEFAHFFTDLLGRSTTSIAMRTPAQKPRGLARMIRMDQR